MNYFVEEAKNASKLVGCGEIELDIVRLVKKLDVIERTLKKKGKMVTFKPKKLELETTERAIVR